MVEKVGQKKINPESGENVSQAKFLYGRLPP
jgi:hypothetical protein